MNVFGHRERSWRKARNHGVSPIIATILLVAITVVLAAVLYVLISGLTHGTGGTTLGSAFAAGTATPPLIQGAAGNTFAANGCLAGHYCYVLTIESAGAGLSASSMNLVIKTATGATFAVGNGEALAGPGGVTIYNSVTATVVAQSANVAAAAPLSVSTWPTGTSTTQLASTMIIIVDTGIPVADATPGGTGLVFSALGVGSYSGTVSVSLP
jgi:flagellin-like protein